MSDSTLPQSTTGQRGRPPELSRRRRFLVLAICCAGMVVVVMDISIVNIALPAIRRDLHASVSGLQWTVDVYTLVLASLLLLAGSTADRVGRRRIFQVGLATFGLGSLLCSLAPSTGWLIAARSLQAVGGTMLNPVAMAIIATTFPDRAERARAIGVFGAMSGLSLGLGPILGGALVDGFGWRSIFWINVPIVAAAIVCTALFVPESRAARGRRFDPVGQSLVILVLGSVVYPIIESGRLGWTSPVILGPLAVAVLGVLGILGYEPRRVDPLLELRLFRSVPFSSAILMALFALCGFGAFLFVTTLYLQNVRGMPALTAGLCLLPVGVLIVVLSPLTGRLVGGRGPRLPLVVSGAALALGGGASIWLGPASPLPAVLAIYLLFGIAQGTINPPITNSAVSGMAGLDGRSGRLCGLHRSADRHRPGRRDRRNDRGIGRDPGRDGVHQRGARRVVAAARARRRHRGPGAAQHRARGHRHRQPGGHPVRGSGPGRGPFEPPPTAAEGSWSAVRRGRGNYGHAGSASRGPASRPQVPTPR
jgi:EmrB/QacA subfamily drug resistance transporter